MEAFRVTRPADGRQPLHGAVARRRREEQRAEADGRLAAGPGPHDDHQPARHPRRRRDGPAARGARLHRRDRPRRRSGSSIDVPEELGHHAPYRLVRRLRASISVLGPLVARCGEARGEPARRRQHRLARARHAHPRAAGPRARRSRSSTATSWRTVPTRLRGAELWLDFPSVGATENLLMAADARRGHHGHRQRRPRAGDRRPVRDAAGDGRRHRGGRRPARWWSQGVDGAAPGRRTRRSPTGSWPAPGPSRRPSPAGTSTVEGGVAAPPRHRAGQARRRPARVGRRRATGLPGRGWTARLDVVRRRHAALPRVPDRPAAVRDGAGRGRATGPR